MITNPYLDAMTPHFGKEAGGIATALTVGRVVQELRKKYAWAIPTVDAAAAIARHAPNGVVEVGAGSGYWKWFLAQAGIDVLAADIGGETKARWAHASHAAVEDAGPEFAGLHPARALLIVKPNDTPDDAMERQWSGYDFSFAVTAFEQYRLAGGKVLIHVGHRYYADTDKRCVGMSREETILGKTYVKPGNPFPAEWKLVDTVTLPTYDEKGFGTEGVYIFTNA